jgi:RimJ/RimL family protein N-acetyltransferase
MWRVLKALHLPYGAYEAPDIDAVDAHTWPLDPIDVAGKVDLKALQSSVTRRGFVAATLAILIVLGDESAFAEHVALSGLEDTAVSTDVTSDKWKAHFLELVSFGILKETSNTQRALSFGRYFAIPKGLTHTARSIFDGRKASARCRAPPPIRTTEVREQVQAFQRVNARYLVLADLRHWFHQLPVGVASEPADRKEGYLSSVSRLFFLKLGSVVYRWKTLPMGWSWSCWICQQIAFAVLTHHEASEEPFFDTNLSAGVQFLSRGSTTTCHLVYDNVAFASSSKTEVDMFLKRFKRNLKLFNVTTKFLHVYDEKELSTEVWKDPKKPAPVHLGCRLWLGPGNVWHLKHDPDKVDHWQKTANLPKAGEESTPRSTSRVLGLLLRHAVVHGTRLCHYAPILQLASRVGKTAHATGWDSCIILSDAEVAAVASRWSELTRNPWGTVDSSSQGVSTRSIYLASDSSSFAWGGVLLPERDTAFSEPLADGIVQARFGPEWKEVHIFYKELYAAVATVRHFTEGVSKATITLFVDNAAAVGVLRRGYSSCHAANVQVAALYEYLEEHGLILQVVDVPGTINPADAASRLMPFDVTRLPLLEALLNQRRTGIFVLGRPEDRPNYNAGLRHPEGEDESAVVAGLTGNDVYWLAARQKRHRSETDGAI